VQDGALALLDEAACHLGSSREELALALVDKRQARAYENTHEVDPRSPGDLLSRILEEEASPVEPAVRPATRPVAPARRHRKLKGPTLALSAASRHLSGA
jgi:hypothetical protein